MAIANRKHTEELLRKYDRSAKKFLGQNFIIDPSVVEKISSFSGENELCLEIGPGLGALTEFLAQRHYKVIAYEIDAHMVEILSESLKKYSNVEVRHEDFLKADLSSLAQKDIVICANLPYYITTPILFKVIDELNIKNMTVMVQKEIGDRLNARVNTKEYGALSIQMQYYFEIDRVMKVSKASFLPQPNVESSVLHLKSRKRDLPFHEKEFFSFVRNCFQFRRKTLLNNLKSIDKDKDYDSIYLSLEWDKNIRSESLKLEDFIKLYEVFYA